jgi:two-component system cell cycle sensor histidine kinase/response regulator CckA
VFDLSPITLLADVPWPARIVTGIVLAVLALLWLIERRARQAAERDMRESLAAEAKCADALVVAQRAAREAQRLEAVGRLTSGVAHDFNNLLTAILGYAQFAQLKLGAEHPQSAYLQQIVNAAERAEKLTRQLLNFSRQESSGPQNFDLNLVVKETGYLLRRLIGEDVALRMKIAPDSAMVRADSGDVAQLIVHLAMNARDAMPHGGELWISTETIGENVTLKIHGSGGVGQAAAALIRGVPSGGLLEIEREGTAEAAFLVSWPRAIEDVSVPPVLSTMPEPLPAEETRKTLLLVEDDNLMRQLMAEVLESQGYNVLTASDGENALDRERAHAGPIALVVTDLVMPRLGGRELVSKLLERRPELPVLYVSAHYDDDIAKSALATRGRVAMLAKPFDMGTLIRAVREALGQAGSTV